MSLTIRKEGEFEFIDEGKGKPIVLLHGLFGALSNWNGVVDHFKNKYRVIIPLLPLYTMPIWKTSVPGLAKFVHEFLEHFKLDDPILIGNSLGGHVGLLYALNHPDKYHSIVLTGSSGLFENGMGGSFPKRGDYEYIKNKTEYTFYDPATATKELVDEVFEIVGDRNKVARVLAMSKSAMRQNLNNELHQIKKPVCLIWGKDDKITPPSAAEEFKKLIPHAELYWIDKCGHAPMMERPEEFNALFEKFLHNLNL